MRVSGAAATSSTLPGDGLRWFYFHDTSLGGWGDFTFGEPGDVPLTWGLEWFSNSGQHLDPRPAVYRNGVFLLSEGLYWGPRWHVVHFGDPGDYPVAWNGDFGVYRNATFYLSKAWDRWLLEQYLGAADVTAHYGDLGDVPLMGTWNGVTDPYSRSDDTIGVYRPSNATFYLRNSNTDGVADVSFVYGNPGDVPFVGDWNDDLIDTIGVYRPSTATFYLRNSNTSGVADVTIALGDPGDYPLAPAPFGGPYQDGVAVIRLSS